MTYEQLIAQIQSFPFIRDADMASAACKAIWGVIASSVDENLAKELTSQLPGELTEQKLRGHQEGRLEVELEAFIQEVSNQFGLDPEQSSTLIQKTIHLGEEMLKKGTYLKLRKSVPNNMTAIV